MREKAGESDGAWRPYAGPLILAASFAALWLLFHGARELSHVLFLGFFAVVLASVFDISVSFLSRGLPRPVAVLLTFLLLILILGGALLLIVPLFLDQARKIAQHAPDAIRRVQEWWTAHTRTGLLGQMAQKGGNGAANGNGSGNEGGVGNEVSAKIGALMKGAIPVAFGTVAALGEAFVAVVLGLYLALQPGDYARGFAGLFPKRKQDAVTDVLDAMGEVLRGWTRGVLVSMAIIGTITGLGLLAVGVEGWFALGVLSFLGEFIPFVGPILAAIPGIAVGLAESPQKALWVLIVYVGTHQIENHVVQPLVMGKAVRIRPAVLILWQMAFALGFGFMGLLVATPLLAVVQAGIRTGYQKRALGIGNPSGVDKL